MATIATPIDQSGFTTSYQKKPVYKGEDATEPQGDHKRRFKVSMKSSETSIILLIFEAQKRKNQQFCQLVMVGEKVYLHRIQVSHFG